MPPPPCLSVFASAADNSGGTDRTTKTATGWRSATTLPPIMEADCALDSMPCSTEARIRVSSCDGGPTAGHRSSARLSTATSTPRPLCPGSQRRVWLRLWVAWGDGGLRWTWQWHHRGAVPRPFLRRGSLALGRRKGPPDRSGRLRRSVGGSDRRVPRQGGKDLLAPDPPLSLLAGALPSHLPLGLCHRILPGLHKGWHLPGRVTKEEGHLISLQATSLQEMLERWLHLPSSSPALLRGYKLSHGTKASSPYGR